MTETGGLAKKGGCAMARCSLALGFIFLGTVGSWGAEVTETRIALVANSVPARSVAELVTAELSREPGVAWVERQDLAPLYREIEMALLAGGMGSLADRIHLAGADLFAVIAADETGEGLSLIVFDAATGIRFADVALGAGDAPEQAHEAAERMCRALEKRSHLDTGDLRSVSVVALRNAGLSGDDAPRVRATGYLLEQMLVNAQDFVLLERRSLEWVNRERWLVPEDEANRLEAGRITLEVEVGPGSTQSLRALALARDSEGMELARIEVEAEETHTLAESLFVELADALDAAPTGGVPGVEREAERLFHEYHFLNGHNRKREALERMEASAALDPAREYPHLVAALMQTPPFGPFEETFDRVERAFDIRRRAQQEDPLLLRSEHMAVSASFPRNYVYPVLRWLCGGRRIAQYPPEMQERREAILRTYVLLNAERAAARADKILADNGNRPLHELDRRALANYCNAFSKASYPSRYSSTWADSLRWMILTWMQYRPEDLERWFEAVPWHAKRNADSVRGLFDRNLGRVGQLLRSIAQEGLQEGDPSVLETAHRLYALYRDLELERYVFVHRSGDRSTMQFEWSSFHPDEAIARAWQPSDVDALPDGDRRDGIRSALDWLADRQLEDGSWIESQSPTEKGTVTSLVLLAFLSSGEGTPGKTYGATVERGLRFIIEDALKADGRLGMRVHPFNISGQGTAAYALCEAYALTGHPVLKKAAEKTVRPILAAQRPSGTIGYALNPRNHVSVSYFVDYIRPLIAAEALGLDVPGLQESIPLAVDALLEAFDANSGHFLSKLNVQPGASPPTPRACCSVKPALALQWVGLKDLPEARAGQSVIDQHGFEWRPVACGTKHRSDLTYFMTQLMYHGGDKAGQARIRRYFASLLDAQASEGSWNKSVLATAFHVLSLSVPDQVLRVHAPLPILSLDRPESDEAEIKVPWRTVIPLMKDKRMVFVVQDGKDIFAAHFPAGHRGNTFIHSGPLHVRRITWPNYDHTQVNREPVHYVPPDIRYDGNYFGNANARVALSPEHIFFGDRNGVWMIPWDGGAPRQITTDDGLPRGAVHALAWLDEALYLVVGDHPLVRFDPASAQVDPLLVSGRLGSDHPLEKLDRPPTFGGVLPDPERERLLLWVYARDPTNISHEKVNGGLWEYRPADGAWFHRLAWSSRARMHRSGDRVVIAAHSAGMDYDLLTNETRVLYSFLSSRNSAEGRDTSSALNGVRDLSLHAPFEVIGDWFWSSIPFARGNIKTGDIETFPTIGAGQHSVVGIGPGKNAVLVATPDGLWALELESNE